MHGSVMQNARARQKMKACNYRVGNHQLPVVRVRVPNTFNRHGNVCNRHGVVAVPQLTACVAAVFSVFVDVQFCREATEVLVGQVDEFVVVNATGSGDDHAWSSVVRVNVFLKVGLGDGPAHGERIWGAVRSVRTITRRQFRCWRGCRACGRRSSTRVVVAITQQRHPLT